METVTTDDFRYVSFRAPAALADALRERARREDRSASSVIRSALARDLDVVVRPAALREAGAE